jgi:hypothetical protein
MKTQVKNHQKPPNFTQMKEPLLMDQSHLPKLKVPVSALHPIVRVIFNVGGGTFRVAPMGGMPYGIPLLTDNALYPFALYLTESENGLAPARKNERNEWVPVLLVADCAQYLPMLSRAYYKAFQTNRMLSAA